MCKGWTKVCSPAVFQVGATVHIAVEAPCRQRPEGQADELDKAGSVPQDVAEGDTSVVARTPKPAKEGVSTVDGDETTSVPQVAPAGGGSAADGLDAALALKRQQLVDLTGLDTGTCLQALQNAGGDVDAAAAALMGFQ